MFFLIIEFFAKWLEERRFPREELKLRLSIALAGAIVLLTLGVLLVVNALN
jgi:hypothetical protein